MVKSTNLIILSFNFEDAVVADSECVIREKMFPMFFYVFFVRSDITKTLPAITDLHFF